MKSSVFLCVVFLFFVTPLFSQTDWSRSTSNPVLEVGPSGSWDDEALIHPSVYFDGTTYHMWYSGYDGTNVRIGYATSPDGTIWVKYAGNPVLDVGPPGSWDDYYTYLPTVVFFDSTFHMWYTGNDGINDQIGHATSPDGIVWTKDLTNPVFILGPPGSWYDVHIGTGFVMMDGNTLHLWFGGSDGTYIRTGHATSTDGGTDWIFNPDNPVLNVGSWDTPRAQSAVVVYNAIRSEFYMLYAGGEFFAWEIGYATSQNLDGPWTKPINESIFKKGGPGTWESNFVAFPYVLFDPVNNIYKMWYTGGAAQYDGKIGYATAPANLPDTIHVPADYPTIQAAIDAATNGNIVLVAEDTYYENINFNGKAITVASHFLIDGDTSHISNTIIDGSQPSHPDSASVVTFGSGEDTTSVLYGFTITGGTGTYSSHWDDRNGGGIYLDSSGAKIKNNIIKNNSVVFNGYAYGAGIMAFCFGSHNLIISNNLIESNYLQGSDTFGAGIALWSNSYSLVFNNIIINNTHNSDYCQGGGIHLGPGDHQIINNYIFNNSALSLLSSGGGAGGIYLISYANMNNAPIIANNLIFHNEGTEGGGIKVWTLTETFSKGSRRNKDEKISTIEKITYNPTIENNSILFNTAPGFGGGILNGNNTPTQIINNIVWGNDGYSTYDQIHGTAQIVTYCNVQGGYGGTGNIDVDPMFDDTTYYCINQNSRCVDAGNPDAMYNDVEDPNNFGFALLPARGTLINDMGCFGGPGSLWSTWDIPVSVRNDANENGVPSEFILLQNYPNPFNPNTTIKYGITGRTFVELKIYDILGRELRQIVSEEQDTGYYEASFNASRLASGVYFYRLQAGSFVVTKKMVLLK